MGTFGKILFSLLNCYFSKAPGDSMLLTSDLIFGSKKLVVFVWLLYLPIEFQLIEVFCVFLFNKGKKHVSGQ